MATSSVFAAIRDFLTANWTATPLRFENKAVPEATRWVYVEISGRSWRQESLGAGAPRSNLWREEGTLWLHCLVPVRTGSEQARSDLTSLCDLFRGAELLDGRLIFNDISVGLGESADEDGNYWRLSASIAWTCDN